MSIPVTLSDDLIILIMFSDDPFSGSLDFFRSS